MFSIFGAKKKLWEKGSSTVTWPSVYDDAWHGDSLSSGGVVFPHFDHRHLGNWRRMHLCMQDDPNGPKNPGVSIRLTRFTVSKMFLVVCYLILTPLWTCLGFKGKSFIDA
jgi:hypothetical protein